MRRSASNGVAKTVVVAGGAGFIGSHLCDALIERGNTVLCVDSFVTGTRENVAPLENHPRFRLITGDVCNRLTIPGPVDEVYNLACAASPPRYQADPVHTMMSNVVGTANLLKLAERHQARFVQASTSEVYGDPQEHPQREGYRGHVNCTGPRACYDEGKRAAEALCFDFLRLGRVDARVARIFNTYGSRMRPDDGRIISNLISQALAGRPLTIYGNGEQTRSFCYISDMVEGLQALMRVETNPGAPINLGNPEEFTVRELAQMVLEQLPTRSRIVHRPLPEDDPRRRWPDISRARKLLRWAPLVPLRDGLAHTIDWFSASRAAADRRNDRLGLTAS